ncbi:MAG: hypothetical protein IK024_12450 [Treponema sp.]|nr:hypothetical protein [Treponema sp.]
MPENQLNEIAEKADMIIRNYAFTRKDNVISILNLKNPEHAMVISPDGTMLETNMDEIEQVIVLNIWKNDAEYMESANA